MKVLVTGADGFVGRWLVRRLTRLVSGAGFTKVALVSEQAEQKRSAKKP